MGTSPSVRGVLASRHNSAAQRTPPRASPCCCCRACVTIAACLRARARACMHPCSAAAAARGTAHAVGDVHHVLHGVQHCMCCCAGRWARFVRFYQVFPFSRMSHRLPRVLPRVRCAVHTFVAWMSMASCWLLSLSCAPASHGSLVWWRSLPRCRLARLAIAPCGHPFLLTSRLSFETFNQVSCFRCLQAYAATHQAGACACSAALLLTLLLCSASCDWMATRSWCT